MARRFAFDWREGLSFRVGRVEVTIYWTKKPTLT